MIALSSTIEHQESGEAIERLSALDKSSVIEFQSAPHKMTNAAALEDIFNKHHALVYRTAYRITGNATEAEDALQTIFLRLAQNAKVFAHVAAHTGAHVETYLRRAAVNAALDIVRARVRHPLDALDDNQHYEGSATEREAHNPYRQYEAAELKRLLRFALAAMHNTAAEAFALKYFENMTNREIAVALDTSPLVVGVMLHRARVRLQKDLKNYMESAR